MSSIVQIHSKKESIIRAAKSTKSAALHILDTDWVTVQLDPEEVVGALTWRGIQFGNIKGYIAMTDNVEIREAPVTENVYSVVWDGMEWTGTLAELERDKQLIQRLMLTILAQFDAPVLMYPASPQSSGG